MSLGFYDSGIGGLNILKQVRNLLPEAKCLYLGDDLHCPIGELGLQEIQKACQDGVNRLFKEGSDIVILACNTASTTSIRYLQHTWLPKTWPDKKVLSIVLPTVEYLRDNNPYKTDVIGIMATPATIRTQFYQDIFWLKGPNRIMDISCPGLALAIEENDFLKINSILKDSFAWLGDMPKDMDYLILACTHYPIIEAKIRTFLQETYQNSQVKLINQSQIVAQKLVEYIHKHSEYSLEAGGVRFFGTSGSQDYALRLERVYANMV